MDINVKEYKTIQSFLYDIMYDFKWRILFLFLSYFFFAIDVSIRGILEKNLINTIKDATSFNIEELTFYPLFWYFITFFLLILVFRIGDFIVDKNMFPKMKKIIELKAFNYLIKHNYSYFQNKNSGELANHLYNMNISIQDLIKSFIELLFCFMMTIFSAYSLSKIKLIFGLGFILWISLFFLTCFFLNKKITKEYGNIAKKGAYVGGLCVDIFSNIVSIKLSNNEKEEEKKIQSGLESIEKSEKEISFYYFIINSVLSSGFLSLLFFCIKTLIKLKKFDVVTIGDFGLIIGTLCFVLVFIWPLQQHMAKFLSAWSKIKTAFEIIFKKQEKKLEINKKFILKNPKIEFKNVSFKYKEDRSDEVLQDISFIINSGEKIGLVGYSGSGKTTLINLILGFFNTQKGSILIDDINTKDINQKNLNEFISLVQQEAILFNRTIKENIMYSKIDATEEDLLDASKKAFCHDFIMNLENQYNTIAGERGMKLSGGQRQRVIIARAFLKNTPIILLDEATSALDSQTEELIQESLEVLSKNKTMIVIAHRLSTLKKMDRILVLDKGKIVEEGSHQELIKNSILYKQLWDKQVNGFI